MTTRKNLYARERFGIRLGLERMERIMSVLDRPDRAWPAIHIAGTNGKGSTAAMIERILREAGYRTGLYTSPHLISPTERFRIDGQAVSDAELDRLLDSVLAAEASADLESPLTFFELTTAAASLLFADRRIDWGICEVGMGGRLDATNILSPRLSVITSIGLDHTEYLGTTLDRIAAEKGGIIKPGVPVVCGAGCDTACEVIHRRARERQSLCVCCREPIDLPIGLQGNFQRYNAALAVQTIDLLREQSLLEVSPDQIRQGLASVEWPGRLQKISERPLILVDGAHNPHAAETLARSLQGDEPKRRFTTILGICSDKESAGILAALATVTDRFILTSLQNERSWDPTAWLATARRHAAASREAPHLAAAIQMASSQLPPHGAILITGSLYLAGEALSEVMFSRKG